MKRWTIPPFTTCAWPYEAMYNRDGLKDSAKIDSIRLEQSALKLINSSLFEFTLVPDEPLD